MCCTLPMDEPLPPGLYIVATPIGNLSDLSPRAAEVLRRCDRILAEDKRVSAKLLAHVGATAPMTAYHDHSGGTERERIVAMLGDKAVALISDAGTPLISDPGYKLVRAARAAGAAIHTIPGPCAAIAALTLAGLPTDRFLFAGFLPAKAKARGEAIAEIADVRASLVLYESGPRLGEVAGRARGGLGTARRCGGARDQQVVRGMRHRHARASLRRATPTHRPRARSSSSSDRQASARRRATRNWTPRSTRRWRGCPRRARRPRSRALLNLPRKRVYARALERSGA